MSRCRWQQPVVGHYPRQAEEELFLPPVVPRRWRDWGGPARPTRCRSWGAAPRVWRAHVECGMWGWQQTVVGHQLQMPTATLKRCIIFVQHCELIARFAWRTMGTAPGTVPLRR